MTHSERRFAPTTVRQDRNGVRYGLEQVSAFIGIRNGIERHAGKVKRVLYYRMLTDSTTRYVLVYLTADNQVTDQDVLSE